MAENNEKDFVRNFINDDDLWTEINVRIINGQRIGQAFINAGDHADRPYHYEMPELAFEITTWEELANSIRNYQASRQAWLESESILAGVPPEEVESYYEKLGKIMEYDKVTV